MPYKINNSGAAILVDGRLVSPGSFYDAPEEAFITTDNPAGETTGSQEVLKVPSYDVITVNAMKEQLTEWEIDFSDHDKDKTTLYNFFEKEWVKRYADGTTD